MSGLGRSDLRDARCAECGARCVPGQSHLEHGYLTEIEGEDLSAYDYEGEREHAKLDALVLPGSAA